MVWDDRFGGSHELALLVPRLANAVGRKYRVGGEDLAQEARIILATEADYYARVLEEGGIAHAAQNLRSRLYKLAEREVDMAGGPDRKDVAEVYAA